MKVIAIVSQKGGSGKTTLALHLATAAEKAGLSTAVLDLDPQASAAGWNDSRKHEVPVVISLVPNRLSQGLEAAREGGAKLGVFQKRRFLLDDRRTESFRLFIGLNNYRLKTVRPCERL
jgi:cellulose biosynthesis protein BcsQ